MRKGIKKLLTVALTATLGLATLAGCGSSSADGGSANGGTTKELSGKIQLAGSTSMEKMCGALMEAFMEEYPNVTVTTEYTGSGAGIESVTSGSVDIGNASRALSDKEKSAGIEENIVAIDGIAMITDKNNKVTNVTKQQLTDIYTGKITNWKDLGGSDEAIIVIGREQPLVQEEHLRNFLKLRINVHMHRNLTVQVLYLPRLQQLQVQSDMFH